MVIPIQRNQSEITVPYVIKWDYEDIYGTGTLVIFAHDEEDAVRRFVRYIHNSKDPLWIERTWRYESFRFITKNIFGWYTYMNSITNVCVKVRQVDQRFGDVIPLVQIFNNEMEKI